MHTRPLHRVLAGCFGASLLLYACTSASREQGLDLVPTVAYAPYVTGFTSGLISGADAVVVEFAEPVATAESGAPAEASLLTVSPSVEGRLSWTNPSTLAFVPAEQLPQDQDYAAVLDLAALFPDVPDSLRRMRFGFRTLAQGLSLSDVSVAPDIPSGDRGLARVTGTLRSFDRAAGPAVASALLATQAERELPVSWEHLPGGRDHRFVVTDVRRGGEASFVSLTWRGEPLGLAFDSTRIVNVAPVDSFKVTRVAVEQDGGQTIRVHFSDLLDRRQDLTGLLRLSDGHAAALSTEDNVVTLRPEARISGEVRVLVDASIRSAQGRSVGLDREWPVRLRDYEPAVEFIGEGVIVPSSQGATVPFRAVALGAVEVRVMRLFTGNVGRFFQDNRMDGRYDLRRLARTVFTGEVPLRGEGAVDLLDWNNYRLDLSRLVEIEPGAIYRVAIDFDQRHARFPCGGDGEAPRGNAGTGPVAATELPYEVRFANYDQTEDYYLDEDDYYDYHEDGVDRDDPCQSAYYHRGRQRTRNFLASDIGLIAKRGGGGELLVVATDLTTAEPISGLDVDLVDAQLQVAASAKTGGNGVAVFREAPGRGAELVVARRGEERGYLQVTDYTALNTSAFDVAGESVADGTRGLIYGERGVWRPGDSIYLTLVLDRDGRDEDLGAPRDPNVYFTFADPSGAVLAERAVRPSAEDFYDLRVATAPDAPTGVYRATVRFGASRLSQSVRVETVMPNRLKVAFDVLDGRGRATPLAGGPAEVADDARLRVAARWLHGAEAGALRADVEYSAAGTPPRFSDERATERYADYDFLDDARPYRVRDDRLFEGTLGQDGRAAFAIPIAQNGGELPPGMIEARFVARVFERSGAFSTVSETAVLSPFDSYVGIRAPEAGSYYGYDASRPIPFEVVALDAGGRPVSRTLEVEVYDVAWSYWWERSDGRSLANYVANAGTSRSYATTLELPEGRATWRADLSRLGFGRKLVRVVDPVSGHATSTEITLQDPRWAYDASARPGGAELLAFTLDGGDYEVGQTARVSLPAFPGARAFLSVERGDRVLSYRWVEGTDQPQTVDLDVTAEMAPNAYVFVSLIQPHAQTANDQPIRLFGVQPINVTDASALLQPRVAVSSPSSPQGTELAPEEAFTVRVSEADGRPMSYTLSIVEEGLLDVTSFRTPDPYRRFNRRLSLGVHTWDLYKWVLGAFEGRLAGLLAVGGDEGLDGEVDPRANRFRPVVKHLGPFELRGGQTAAHTLEMPNYMGSVRVMVVAGRDGAYGSTETTRPVRRPLMVMATLPRVVSPGEEIELPVTVFASEARIERVRLRLDDLALLEPARREATATFYRPGEQVVRFRLKVPERLGVARVRVVAEGGGFAATDEVELEVRAPNPRTTDIATAVIEPGETWAGTYAAVGLAGTNAGSVEVGGDLPLGLERRLDYLVGYPHGCIEQTTSKAFPQLYLADLIELSPARATQTQRNVEAAIAGLGRFVRGDGSLSYWPGGGQASTWGTSYAGHFLAAAREKGYRVPEGLWRGWLGYQQRTANAWTVELARNRFDESPFTQAYRLLTLAAADAPQLGAMNRLRGADSLSAPTLQLLAASYALVGQTGAAKDVLAKAARAPAPTRDYAYRAVTYGSDLRDDAIGLYVHTLLRDRATSYKLAQGISRAMTSEQWYSTQTTAWALLAMSEYLGGEDQGQPLEYAYAIGAEAPRDARQEAPLRVYPVSAPEVDGQRVRITNTGDRRLRVSVVSSGIVADAADAPPSRENLELTVAYETPEGKPLEPAAIAQGTDFVAVATIRHPGRLGNYHDLALTQMFPAGWEIRNRRLEGRAALPAGLDHQDVRDDRVLSYFDLAKGESLTVRTELNAAYVGAYQLPQVYAQAMYDRDVRALVSGGRVEVQPVREQ